jgi:DNA-binding transcriptional LysR family regulator
MTLDQLAVFVAVAEREHVTRAAEALNLTQSGASAAIAGLERELGTKLFHRVGRNIALTEGGKLFVAEARTILARVESATLAVQEMLALKRGRISIKASQTIASHFLPPRLVEFHRRHPGIKLSVSIGNSSQVAHAVGDGEVELGLIEGLKDDIDNQHLVTELVAEDRIALVVSPDHPWARRRKLTPQDLAATAWAVREDGSGTRAIFHQALAKLGVPRSEQRVAIELPSNEAVLTAVVAGVGPAILSESVCASCIAAGTLKRLPVTLDSRSFYAVQHGDRYRSRAVTTLLEMLKSNARG